MENLTNLLMSLIAQKQLNINVEYYDKQDQLISTTTDVVDLTLQIQDHLKKIIGQSEYNKLLYNLQQQWQILGFDGIDITLHLQAIDDVIGDALQPAVNTPVAQSGYPQSFFDTELNQAVVKVIIDSTGITEGAVYEIRYYYDGETPSDYRAFFTTLTTFEFPVVPNKTIHVNIRAHKLNSVSQDVEYTLLTARDTTPPAQPTVVNTTPIYKGTIIEFEPQTELDFDHFEVQFNVNGTNYVFESSTTKLSFIIPEVYSGITATAYQIDTSGNKSEGTPVNISSLSFSEAESTVYNTIQNNQLTLNILTDQTTYTKEITAISGNIITVDSVDNIQVGYYAEIDGKVYKIEQINGQDLTLDGNPPSDQTIANISSPIQTYGTSINQLDDRIKITQQKLDTDYTETVIDGTIVTYSPGVITDPNKDFEDVDYTEPGYIVVLIDSEGNEYTTTVTGVDNILKQLTLADQPAGPFDKYRVYTPAQFVQSQLQVDYDSITSIVQKTNFDIVKQGTVASINGSTGVITVSGENFDAIKINSIVNLTDGDLVRYYTISAVSGETFTVTPTTYLDKFDAQNTTYKIYDESSILQSAISQTQNEISTAVVNTTQDLETQIQQTDSMINLRVLKLNQDEPTQGLTELSIQNGKILVTADQFHISGDQVVEGQLDQGKVSIQAGNATIDGTGIKLEQGHIALGYDNQLLKYNALINNDGSGHLAQGNISWETDGSFTINAVDPNSSVTINTSNFTLTDGVNNAQFQLENGKFVFDGNVIIRGGYITFDSLDETTQQKINEADSFINQLTVQLEQLQGTVLDYDTTQTVIRQRIFQKSVEVNANDTTDNLENNQFTYKWYVVADDGTKTELTQFADYPEIVLTKDMVNKKLQIECEQDWKV